MNNNNLCIVGAGLAGLLAAHAWPNAPILEAAPKPRETHRALLRFRTPKVGELTGVEFRRVRVRKGIWERGAFVPPSIRAANHYESKVLGGALRLRGDRSIWNIDAVERWIAPEDFYDQLLAQVGHRVRYDFPADFHGLSHLHPENVVINTAPMHLPLQSLGIPVLLQFHRSAIRVRRFRLPEGCDAFQTIYFPDPALNVYRASITGRLVIVEMTGHSDKASDVESILAVEQAFGVEGALEASIEMPPVEQKYGKIEPLHEPTRKELVFRLSHEHRIFSLGRFATWRNILLDDVADDISVIKRLLKAQGSYDARRAAT